MTSESLISDVSYWLGYKTSITPVIAYQVLQNLIQYMWRIFFIYLVVMDHFLSSRVVWNPKLGTRTRAKAQFIGNRSSLNQPQSDQLYTLTSQIKWVIWAQTCKTSPTCPNVWAFHLNMINAELTMNKPICKNLW